MKNITIILFASLRESLGEGSIELAIENSLTITEIIQLLAETKGQIWHESLAADQVLYAVNQTLVEATHLVQAGDELAFLPPVTGG